MKYQVVWLIGTMTGRGIAMMNFKDEDRMQLAQLVGYSVSGYGSLDYVTERSRNAADKRALKAMEDA